MAYYVGLDISQKQTSICVVNGQGKVIAEGKTLTQADAIYSWLGDRVKIAEITKAGLEAGSLSNWLYTGLSKLGLPVVCLETFQAHQFLATQRNKTDKNDARGLAQLVRMGEDFLKLVSVRSRHNQEVRALLSTREHLVHEKVRLENHICGILKPFGLIVARGCLSTDTFCARVAEVIVNAEKSGIGLESMLMPVLELYRNVRKQLDALTKQTRTLAQSIPVCKRFMTVPGVGPIVALSFFCAVDRPERFKKSEDVGAYFGRTPKQYQSGESDFKLGVSKRGDSMVRRHLMAAAIVLLCSTKSWCSLKAWGIQLAKRQGLGKARVAVARKLAIILHRMWINDQDFRWTATAATELGSPMLS